MSRRILTGLIAIIYLAFSSGVVMSIHYCMGKLSSVSFDPIAGSTCICGMPKDDSNKKTCCKTEYKVVKMEDSHKAAYASLLVQTPVSILPVTLNLLQQPTLVNAESIPTYIHGPPLLSQQDTYLRNCVFRI
jgi:hypothetical protein